MIPAGRQRLLALAGLTAVLGTIIVWNWSGEPAAVVPPASNPSAATADASPQLPVADVKLEALEGNAVQLGDAERNPFRFQARPAPPPPSSSAPRGRVSAAPPPGLVLPAPPGPIGPPPPPPITLRYIGLVEAPTQAGRIAMLSDGRGNVFYGKEGDIIEGRYRILRVGPDSAELAYLDGRGRQTFRLSGQ